MKPFRLKENLALMESFMDVRNLTEQKITCPLTGKLFLEPVNLPSGNLVEREAIEVKLDEKGNGVNPFTLQPLSMKALKLDKDTRAQVNEFLKSHPDRKKDRFIKGSLKPKSSTHDEAIDILRPVPDAPYCDSIESSNIEGLVDFAARNKDAFNKVVFFDLFHSLKGSSDLMAMPRSSSQNLTTTATASNQKTNFLFNPAKELSKEEKEERAKREYWSSMVAPPKK